MTSRAAVMMEFSALRLESHCPIGIYISPTDIFKWSGVLFVHRGYYASAVLHFTLTIPRDYPSTTPLVHFETDIYHPLGKLSMTSRFPRWKQREDYLYHVLHFIKNSFKRKALDELREANCFNKEAFDLYRDQHELYTKLAAQSALLSIADSSLYSDSPAGVRHAPGIRFSKLDEKTEFELKESIETR